MAQVEKKITSRTNVILPAHLFGHPLAVDPPMELAEVHGLWVRADALSAYAFDPAETPQPANLFNRGVCVSESPILTAEQRVLTVETTRTIRVK